MLPSYRAGSRRYTVTTRTWSPVYDPAHGHAVLGSFLKKKDALAAAEAALAQPNVHYARVAREVFTEGIEGPLLGRKDAWFWADQGEVKCLQRRITRQEIVAGGLA